MPKDYRIVIFSFDEDECYVALVPDLPHCMAFGDTPEEALREIQIAKEGWLEVARSHDIPIPEPTEAPEAAHSA